MSGIRYEKKDVAKSNYDSTEPPIMIFPKPEVEFTGPFQEAKKAYLSVKNVTDARIITQVFVTDFENLRARPKSKFFSKGEAIEFTFQTLPFVYDPKKSYDDRAFYLFVAECLPYVEEVDNVLCKCTDPDLYVFCIPAERWKKYRIDVKYWDAEKDLQSPNAID